MPKNSTATKFCHLPLEGPVIMPHRVYLLTGCTTDGSTHAVLLSVRVRKHNASAARTHRPSSQAEAQIRQRTKNSAGKCTQKSPLSKDNNKCIQKKKNFRTDQGYLRGSSSPLRRSEPATVKPNQANTESKSAGWLAPLTAFNSLGQHASSPGITGPILLCRTQHFLLSHGCKQWYFTVQCAYPWTYGQATLVLVAWPLTFWSQKLKHSSLSQKSIKTEVLVKFSPVIFKISY